MCSVSALSGASSKRVVIGKWSVLGGRCSGTVVQLIRSLVIFLVLKKLSGHVYDPEPQDCKVGRLRGRV